MMIFLVITFAFGGGSIGSTGFGLAVSFFEGGLRTTVFLGISLGF